MSASTLPASNMPSPSQIQREYSNLREIRRRSVSTEKGSLMVDPDLPELSPTSTSPIGQQGYWSEPTVPEVFSPVSEEAKVAEEAMDDPTNLFWVPAHLHPELAPGEFRAFLKAHTRSLPQNDIPASPLSPSTHSQTTVAGSGLGRKKSMLSRQYQPKENDGVENEPVPLPSRMASGRRNRNSIFRENDGPQLTIDDLQKLEELAEEASKSDDPSKLRSVLRRSLSLNVAPAFLDTVDDIAELDEADAPIIVPRPGQTLRRAARTKIRKANLPGDGGGHRFPATRKTRRTSAGRSTEDATSERPISYSDETAIFDSYGAASPDISDEGHGDFESNPPSELDHEVQVIATPALPIEVQPPTPPQPQEARAPALVHPTPQRHLAIPSPISVATQPARTPSPVSPHHPSASPPESPKSAVEPTSPTASLATSQETSSTTIHVPSTPTASTSTTTLVHPAHEKHEPHPHAAGRSAPAASPTKPAFHVTPPTKEKKGGLFSKKKDNHKLSKSKQSDNASVKSSVSEREKEKEKEGFFGSLFGGKKKAEESPHAGGLFSGGGAGQAAAAKLLGASKSGKDMHRPTSPGPGGLNNFSRYPIHVERAVYRLSHIKLASPRRPLYEQVLISNLMFWYLGIINRPAGEDPPPKKAKEEKEEAPPTPEHRPQSAGTPGKEPSERDSLLKRGNSFGRQSSPPHPIPHSPPHAATLRSSSPPPPVANHAPPKAAGSLNHNQRSAEMPIRSPQYEVQHRMIAQGQAAPGHEGMSRPGMPNGQHPGQSRQPQPGQPGAHSGMPGGSAGRPRTGSPPPGAMNPFTESHPQFAQGAESRPPMEGRAPREGRGTTPETRVLSPRGPESLGRGPPPQGANLPNGQAPAGPIPPGAHPSLVPQNPAVVMRRDELVLHLQPHRPTMAALSERNRHLASVQVPAVLASQCHLDRIAVPALALVASSLVRYSALHLAPDFLVRLDLADLLRCRHPPVGTYRLEPCLLNKHG
ncbi:hypothetical protein DACRYDRAFT_99140 [Dacryopinax primogenitus]|uniref:Protein Zds1 C-terminal domain-containing protein n=1 Tax=Dacryopinax primogenitus (strain DJM 731) TaxID=1858805 RepID=M5G5J1_DACPD|nr:uncharacterized protein DACRYDRAFT_99140 [Dacryopinax primogenitus]EJU03490.1 hypothetical protein DACRYDRAFT_99140 [Dacryopinax primogenitus]